MNVLTALDAFLCHVLLKRCIEKEKLFKASMFKLAPSSKKDKWKKLMDVRKDGEWELEENCGVCGRFSGGGKRTVESGARRTVWDGGM